MGKDRAGPSRAQRNAAALDMLHRAPSCYTWRVTNDTDNEGDQRTTMVRVVPETPGIETAPGPPALIVRLAEGEPVRFTEAFRVGRGEECQIRVASADVSRCHAEIAPGEDSWAVRDLDSTNGTFLDGLRVDGAALPPRGVITLGPSGPSLEFAVEGAGAGADPPSITYFIRHYVDGRSDGPVGRETMMIRRAVAKVRGRQRLKYLVAILVVVAAGAAVSMLAVRQRAELTRQRSAAQEIFYAMKGLELQLDGLEARLGDHDDPGVRTELASGRARLRDLSKSYDRFLEELGLFGEGVDERRRLVLRMVRLFGECEVAMPPGLSEEIDRTIASWQADTRLVKALDRARSAGYARIAAAEFSRYNLPPQLFYLALQESDFRLDACGPKTRFGIAKGPWQLLPSTARAYGLRTGPLFLLRRPDPEDERQDFTRSTEAAASFLHDLYTRETQASALLAVAAYNWGGSNVRRMIRELPQDPRRRNFWRVLVEHRSEVPRETWGYVFRVLTAAVIGENPRLYGFDFPPPLAGALPEDGDTVTSK
jgi:membrane-bound lytic murein transglycosylase D